MQPPNERLLNWKSQSVRANKGVLRRANKMDSTIPWILAATSFPVMAGKQFINVIQLVKASRWLAEGDVAERKRMGLPKRKKVA